MLPPMTHRHTTELWYTTLQLCVVNEPCGTLYIYMVDTVISLYTCLCMTLVGMTLSHNIIVSCDVNFQLICSFSLFLCNTCLNYVTFTQLWSVTVFSAPMPYLIGVHSSLMDVSLLMCIKHNTYATTSY